jgi:hypothetical protein
VTIRRTAPRRDVVEVVRVGEWGEVLYRHRLSCGHVETRKRPAKSDMVGCATCAMDQMLKKIHDAMVDDDGGDSLATIEVSIAQMRATIASRCDVPLEAVDVVMGDGGMSLSYVTVFFDADAARRFVR